MSKLQTPVKRAYLSKSKRKAQLIEAAALMVETKGWFALNMTTLADEIGVSRQLVYQHFPSLESLLTATAQAIFTDTMQGTVTAITLHQCNMAEAIKAASVVSLDLPQGKGDALWQMIAGLNLGLPELELIRCSIRDLVIQMWTPMARQQLGLEDGAAKSLVWMMIMAFWGIRNMARDGLISRDQAIAEFTLLADQVFSHRKSAK